MLRTYTDRDFAACVALVNTVWNFDARFKPPALSALFKEMYVGVSLAASNFYQVVEEDGRVVGFLFAKGGAGSLYHNAYSGLTGIARFFYRLLTLRGAPMRRKVYYAGIIVQHEWNRRAVEATRANEAHLMAVDPSAQGKGYGRLLMDAYIAHCRAAQIGRITLETDRESNYGFFEHYGFTVKGEFYSPLQHAYTGTSGQSFVYELKL